MTPRRKSIERVLHWYPPAWRERYGDELRVLLEDSSAEMILTNRVLWSLRRSGAAERLRSVGLVGDSTGPEVRVRSATLLVMCAWAVVVIGGVGFAKLAENWDAVASPTKVLLPRVAYDMVEVASLIGTAVLLTAALVVAPSFGRLVKHQGWSYVARPLRGILMAFATALVPTVAVIAIAHNFSPKPGRGPNFLDRIVIGMWALTLIIAIALWTRNVTVLVSRLELSAKTVRQLGRLAFVTTTAIGAVLVGTLVWWWSMAANVPRFFTGGHQGFVGTAAPVTLAGVMVLMVVALLASIAGCIRIWNSARSPQRLSPTN